MYLGETQGVAKRGVENLIAELVQTSIGKGCREQPRIGDR